MAGIVIQESDLLNHRVVSMWGEAGIQFRSNLLLAPGAQIQLHSHSYDHVAFINHGLFEVDEISLGGEKKNYRVASREWGLDLLQRVLIPAGHQHRFTLLENRGTPGEVLCMWGG